MTKSAVPVRTPAPEPAQRTMSLDLSPSPDAPRGLTLRQEASALVITDVETHRVGKIFIRDCKTIKRNIEDHWSRITRRVDELKRGLLDDKRKDLEPVEMAISVAERVVLAYENIENERVRLENERRRLAAETAAQTKRDAELADQERRALELEQQSDALSAREQVFVECLVLMGEGKATQAAQRAGFLKDPVKQADRLMASAKIFKAIEARRSAIALRQQQSALKAAPVDVPPVEEVKRQVASVAGVSSRTYYSCDPEIDEASLWAAVLAGTVDREAFMPNLPYLNRQAKQLKTLFEATFPGCQLDKRQGVAG